MKMYTVYGSTMYGSGMAVVAADSPKEAREITVARAYGFHDPMYNLEIVKVEIIRGANIMRKNAAVLSSTAYIE